MWITTTQGFYSAVEHREDPEKIMVRVRVKADLTALKRQIPDLKPYRVKRSDYPWRAVISRQAWVEAVALLAEDVDYDNFKHAVKARQGARRAGVYMRVWAALLDLEPRRRWPKVRVPKQLEWEPPMETRCKECSTFLLAGEHETGLCSWCDPASPEYRSIMERPV